MRYSLLAAAMLVSSCSVAPPSSPPSPTPVRSQVAPLLVVDLSDGELQHDLDFTLHQYDQAWGGAGIRGPGYRHVIGRNEEVGVNALADGDQAITYGLNMKNASSVGLPIQAAGKTMVALPETDPVLLSPEAMRIYEKYCGILPGTLTPSELDFIAERGMARGVPSVLASDCSPPK